MFVLGMLSVFVGISLLAPDDSKGMKLHHQDSNMHMIDIGTYSEPFQEVKPRVPH